MTSRQRTSIPPDLFDAIVEETQRRLLGQLQEQRVIIPAAIDQDGVRIAEARIIATAPTPAPTRVRRNTLGARIAFLVIMSSVLVLSVGFSIGLGLSAAGLLLAFTVLPISVPFFVIGGVAALGLFLLYRFIGRMSGRAASKADWIRAQKRLRTPERP